MRRCSRWRVVVVSPDVTAGGCCRPHAWIQSPPRFPVMTCPSVVDKDGFERCAHHPFLGSVRTFVVRMNIGNFTELSRRLDTTGIDFDAFRSQPLDESVLRCLRYTHDAELHTVCSLRDLLVTSVHRHPEITAFLTMWKMEECWHGEAIANVLAAPGEPAKRERLVPMRQRLQWKDRVASILHSLGSSIAGESFISMHMTCVDRPVETNHEAGGSPYRFLCIAGRSAIGR